MSKFYQIVQQQIVVRRNFRSGRSRTSEGHWSGVD